MKIRNLLLSGGLVVASLLNNSCNARYEQITLPNGFKTEGKLSYQDNPTVFSEKFPEKSFIETSFRDLQENSRLVGKVKDIGLLIEDNDKQQKNIQNLTQFAVGGSGGLLLSNGGNATNKISSEYYNVVISFESNDSLKSYTVLVNADMSKVPPSALLSKLKKGDLISIPTVRYSNSYGGGFDSKCSYYKILNQTDCWKTEEIKSVSSKD